MPLIGAKRLNTDLLDSTAPKGWPAFMQGTGLAYLQEYDVAELLLGVVGYSDGAVPPRPHVLPVVEHVVREVAGQRLPPPAGAPPIIPINRVPSFPGWRADQEVDENIDFMEALIRPAFGVKVKAKTSSTLGGTPPGQVSR